MKTNKVRSINDLEHKRTDEQFWAEAKRRLEETRKAAEQKSALSEENTQKKFLKRAEELSLKRKKKKEGKAFLEVVEFLLSDEKYAIESLYVAEVCPLKNFTQIPCTPSFVLGIINVRGQILSVIDLKKFFDLPEGGLSDLNRVVILRAGEMAFGILADSIVGVESILIMDMQPSLPTLSGVRKEYLKGVTEKRTIVLDAKKILLDPDIIVHEEVKV